MTLDILSLGMAFAVGAGLGFLHFGGLWQTVQRAATARQPYLLLWASALGRLVVTIGGFYGVLVWGDWIRLIVCLGGFVGVRCVLIRHWRQPLPDLPGKE